MNPTTYRPFPGPFPASLDLIPDVDFVNPVENQRSMSACTGFAASKTAEMFRQLHGMPRLDLSATFNYKLSRFLLGFTADAGSTGAAAFQAGERYGFATEALHSSEESNVDAEPSVAAYADAANRKVKRWQNVPVTVDAMKSALMQKLPVMLMMPVPQGIFECTGTFAQQMLDPNQRNWFCYRGNQMIGFHEMTGTIGWDNDLGGFFKLQNQWGPAWGDGGFLALPYMALERGDVKELSVLMEFDGIDVQDYFGKLVADRTMEVLGRMPFNDHRGNEVELWRSAFDADWVTVNGIRWSLTQSTEFKQRLLDGDPAAYRHAYGSYAPNTPSPPMPVYRGPGDY